MQFAYLVQLQPDHSDGRAPVGLLTLYYIASSPHII